MTETGAGAVIIASKEPRHIGSSCFGAEEDDVQVRIVTDAGVEAATGEPGELLVRHAGDDPRYGFFAGYLKDAAATDEAWEGGWFHTGDIVRREADGALRFVDRKKNVIRRSGENISAVEVESVLMQHPLVKAVAVAAVPDAVRGDEVLACVVPADPLATDADRQEAARAIVQWSLEQLAYYKAPGYVAFVDSLPLTTTNKIQRGEMKALAPTLPGTAHCVDTCAMKRKPRENPRRSRAMSRLGYDGVVAALPVTIPYERYSTHAAHWWLGRALGALIRQAGLAKTDVDGLCVSSFTLAPDSAVGLVQHLGMSPRWLDHIPMGGASGVAALRRAARRAGRRRRDRGLHRGRHQSRGLVPQHRQPVLALRPGRRVSLRRRRPERQLRAADRALYARVRRHPRDFGKLCVAQRDNALRYPHALMKKPLTLEQYLGARVITDPIHLFDCVMPCAGADAFLVMSESRARALKLPHARILSTIERHNAWIDDPIQTRGGWTMDVDELYGMAGCAPADMDFLQAYDDYPVINLMQMEDLGFCAKNEGPEFVRRHSFTIDGSFPFNTNGGQLSVGQAAAATWA